MIAQRKEKSVQCILERDETGVYRFTFKSVQRMAEETALLDSGVRENFLDKDVWRGLATGRVWLKRPIPVHNVDGTENRSGRIEYYCWLQVKPGERTDKMGFYLTNLGKNRFILGTHSCGPSTHGLTGRRDDCSKEKSK